MINRLANAEVPAFGQVQVSSGSGLHSSAEGFTVFHSFSVTLLEEFTLTLHPSEFPWLYMRKQPDPCAPAQLTSISSIVYLVVALFVLHLVIVTIVDVKDGAKVVQTVQNILLLFQ